MFSLTSKYNKLLPPIFDPKRCPFMPLLNEAFQALSDGTRRDILCLLGRCDMTAGEIADQFTISKPSISHHLSVLKQAHLVRSQRQGQHIVYSIDGAVLHAVVSWVLNILPKH